ncbi:hypothetical protein K438DRAFT_2096520 [Mycena galopus ATCC 62051]|nr:hypothetical protein K438DRAFT_1765723 [Mycena galopus ATCC 62051]KAF8205309.1 hypothetical protein K438DRAFT_2096520 [Mycena galopus ATCC 62051]
MSTQSILAQHPKFPPRNRVPSNNPVLGFHESSDLLLGFLLFRETPDISLRAYSATEHLVDPTRNANWVLHDLALRYCYDTEIYCDVEGELCPFPVTRYVYRRDPALRWDEIISFLLTGAIPARYPPREEAGRINEPMNADNFKKLTRRFYTKEHRDGSVVLYERSSRLQVQLHFSNFEYWFADGVVRRWRSRSIPDNGLTVKDAADVHDLVLRYGPKVWHLNGLQRAAECIYNYRTGRQPALPIDEFHDPHGSRS